MKNIIAALMATVTLLTFGSQVSASTVGNAGFVYDMYDDCLGRRPTFSEIMNWNHDVSGRQMAYEFLTSEEFIDRDLTEAEIINIYYNVFLDEDATETEIDFWEDRITVDDQTILFYGLINCEQFINRCESNGMHAGEEIFDADAFTEGICPASAECGLTDTGSYVFYTYSPNGTLVYHEVIGAIS